MFNNQDTRVTTYNFHNEQQHTVVTLFAGISILTQAQIVVILINARGSVPARTRAAFVVWVSWFAYR